PFSVDLLYKFSFSSLFVVNKLLTRKEELLPSQCTEANAPFGKCNCDPVFPCVVAYIEFGSEDFDFCFAHAQDKGTLGVFSNVKEGLSMAHFHFSGKK